MWTRDQVLAASHAWQWIPPGAEELHVDDVVVIDYPEWARMGFYAMPAHVRDPDMSDLSLPRRPAERTLILGGPGQPMSVRSHVTLICRDRDARAVLRRQRGRDAV